MHTHHYHSASQCHLAPQEIWEYAYLFSREKGQKCVQLDTAIAMWQLLFDQMHWPLAEAWCSFVQTHHRRAISRDTWTQLLDFIRVSQLAV